MRFAAAAWFVSALAVVSAQVPAPAFTNIAKGDASGQQIGRQVTIRTAAE